MKKKFAMIFAVFFLLMQLFGGTTALAWASYESGWSFLLSNVWNPVHEDITAICAGTNLAAANRKPEIGVFY